MNINCACAVMTVLFAEVMFAVVALISLQALRIFPKRGWGFAGRK
jgi:hypothetical protein